MRYKANKTEENPMGVRPVLPLLLSMSFPPMISMLIQSMYNIVDSIYLASYSKEALTAVSLVYPLQNLALAIQVGFGVGINACMARSLGEKNREMTSSIVAHGIFCSLVHSLLFVVIGLGFTGPFVGMFTDNQEIYEMGKSYGAIVMTMAFGATFHIFIEKMFQAHGNMLIPMFLQAAGALVNIVLDPIFIFGYFGLEPMGVTGAAVATVIGQITACILAIILFLKGNMDIELKGRRFPIDGKLLKRIYSIAVPSAALTALPSVMVSILNGILAGLSESAVSILGVYIKLQSFVYMPANGVIQGLRPIVGYCYGAGKPDRIKKAAESAMGSIAVIMLLGTLLFLLIPGTIMGLFSPDEEMLRQGTQALRIISTGFFISSVSLTVSGVFEGLGNGVASLAVNLVRQFLVIPPVALFLSGTSLGLAGVWAAFPIAEILAAILAAVLYQKRIKERIFLPLS